jgi:hypothetical protein
MQFLRVYRSFFAFSMKELGALIGHGIQIELASDTLIFRHLYRYSDIERDLIRSRTLDLDCLLLILLITPTRPELPRVASKPQNAEEMPFTPKLLRICPLRLVSLPETSIQLNHIA